MAAAASTTSRACAKPCMLWAPSGLILPSHRQLQGPGAATIISLGMHLRLQMATRSWHLTAKAATAALPFLAARKLLGGALPSTRVQVSNCDSSYAGCVAPA